ncbi:MAG: ATP-binding protein [Bryobacteraceae bacterium]|jgi:signal transduction histidine kinase
MSGPSQSPSIRHPARPRGVVRLFGDLRVRPKLMVLHNLFFLVLSVAVYFALIPVFEQEVRQAQVRSLNAGASSQQPQAEYHQVIRQAKINLFWVLGAVYAAAVLLLEAAIMPLYVYRPLGAMLRADEASQHDDRARELIDVSEIPGDEIGQIMRSRNTTVEELRRQEEQLEEALQQLTRTAEALRLKNEQLEAQDRLVSLGILSASVAHELNTPLAVLQGSLEKLLEVTSDAHTHDRLARMLRVTQRLRTISESLVGFSRVRRQSTETVLVRPVVEEAWNLVAFAGKAASAGFLVAVDANAAVRGNADRLVQVFVNLLRNALNAVPAQDGRIAVRARTEKNRVIISIEDNGPGIPPEVLPDIFEAFVSTRLDARGTGLGLTVAQGIVHQHGGTITASNRAEGGACLEVALPAAAG